MNERPHVLGIHDVYNFLVKRGMVAEQALLEIKKQIFTGQLPIHAQAYIDVICSDDDTIRRRPADWDTRVDEKRKQLSFPCSLFSKP